jgi:broad specificity phosphatase PhoE
MNRFFLWLLGLFSLLAFTLDAQAGLKIYYIRHGEAGHNVRDAWRNVPKDQWPAYVGNENMFTPKGETQVKAVPAKLEKFHFDFIAVSPMWRTRHTILPYLTATGLTGEIWPELHETPYPAQIEAPGLPKASRSILDKGPAIQIPTDESSFFRLRQDGKREFRLSTTTDPQFSADMHFVIGQLLGRIREQFGNSDKSILLVGHGSNGKALLKVLAPKGLPEKDFWLKNTGVWMAEEQPDGSFKLEMLNDEPVEKGADSAQPRALVPN